MNQQYTFHKAYQHNTPLRNSLDNLAQKCFDGLSFNNWYDKGFWNDRCTPYTLFNGDKAVSNIFANNFTPIIDGEQKQYIQIGTVMTDPEYRNQGLSRCLMQKIFADYVPTSDAIYLYANDSVLDFYPKFGFIKTQEYQHSMSASHKDGNIKKLDINNTADYQLLLKHAENPNPYSATPMLNNISIVMFHCLTFMQECIYYLPNYDTIVVAKQDSETLYCYDIFGNGNTPIIDIVSTISSKVTNTVTFGFTPKTIENCTISPIIEEDTTMFVLSDKDNIFQNNKLMMPMLSHT